MIRVLLLLLFFVLLMAETLGLNLSLAPGLSVKNAFLYLVAMIILIDTALAHNRRLELLSVVVPYALCISYAGLTWLIVVLIVDYPGYGALGSLISLKSALAEHLLVFLVFFYGTLNSKDALQLLKMILWTVIVVNVITIVDALDIPDLGLIHERRDGRIGGPIGESNQYAVFLTLFLPAGIALVLAEQGWRRKLAILGVAASGLALLMTASRGGMAGVLVGAALGAIYLRKFVSTRLVVSAIGGLLALSVVIFAILHVTGYTDLFYERIFVQTSSSNAFDVSSGRTVIWTMALSRMLDHPLSFIFGFGWDTYSQFPGFWAAPHNSYLKILFELGAIGLTLVLLAFANILRTAREGLRKAESKAAIMLFTFVFGFFGVLVAIFFVDIFSPWLFIWAYAGVAMRLAMLHDDSSLAARGGDHPKSVASLRPVRQLEVGSRNRPLPFARAADRPRGSR